LHCRSGMQRDEILEYPYLTYLFQVLIVMIVLIVVMFMQMFVQFQAHHG
jgi:hypothetical protein